MARGVCCKCKRVFKLVKGERGFDVIPVHSEEFNKGNCRGSLVVPTKVLYGNEEK